MSEELLRITGLTIGFQTFEGVVQALENVSFTVNRGETFGLVGESGCGKTTTGLAVIRALSPNAVIRDGSMTFNGVELLKASKTDKIGEEQISIVFQDPSTSLNPLFTIGQQLSEVLRSRFRSEETELKKMAIQMLRDVRLPEPEKVYGMYPHELSGGMQQRCVIAIALSTKPRLLIADEPTTMLDVTIQAQILDLLADLKRRLDFSMLFITHNLGIVAEICDRVAIMYAGTIVEQGRVEEVFESPLHPYTSGLLEAVPQVVKKSRLMEIPGTVPNLVSPPTGCRFHPRCRHAMLECRMKPPEPIEVQPRHIVACYYSAKHEV